LQSYASASAVRHSSSDSAPSSAFLRGSVAGYRVTHGDRSKGAGVTKAAGLEDLAAFVLATAIAIGVNARHADDALAIGVEAADDAGPDGVAAAFVGRAGDGPESPDAIIVRSLCMRIIESYFNVPHGFLWCPLSGFCRGC
jgi:hypothetical protein